MTQPAASRSGSPSHRCARRTVSGPYQRLVQRLEGLNVVAFVAFVGLGSSEANAAPTAFPLGTPQGHLGCLANAVNDSGVSVGYCTPIGGGRGRAVRWSSTGFPTVLPDLGGDSNAVSINNAGTAVGYALAATGFYRAIRWGSDNTITDLGTSPLDNEANATGINNNGVIVGASSFFDPDPESQQSRTHAVLWNTAGAITDLGVDRGDEYSVANAINDSNIIIGVSGRAGFDHGALWNSQGAMSFLSGLYTSNPIVELVGINNSGIVAGYDAPTAPGPQTHALRWTNGTPVDLGTFSGASRPYAINSAGTVVGYSLVSGAAHPVRWTTTTIQDLGIPSSYAGCIVAAINTQGMMVGYCFTATQSYQAVRWLE